MSITKWLAITFAAIAVLLYRFHEPLPACFEDVPMSKVFGLWFKPNIDSLAGLLDHAGVATKTQVQRAAMKLFLRREADTAELGSLDTEFDGVPVRVYIPAKRPSHGAALFYVHGGAMALGDINTYDSVVRHFSSEFNLVAVSVDYPKAPENPFPAAVTAVERAFRHFVKHAAEFDVDASRIAVAGDSAGGTLVTVLALRMRDALELKKETDAPRIKLQILLYPAVQIFEFSSVSRLMNMHDFVLPRYATIAYRLQYVLGMDFYNSTIRHWAKRYLYGRCYELRDEFKGKLEQAYRGNAKGDDLRNRILSDQDRTFMDNFRSDQVARTKYIERNCTLTDQELLEVERRIHPMFEQDASPLLADSLRHLPPTYIVAAGQDGLRDDALLYAERLRDSGVTVFQKNFDKECHGFISYGKIHLVAHDLKTLLQKNPQLL